jgi:acyl-CoA thioesterase
MNPVLNNLRRFVGAEHRPPDEGVSLWLQGIFREVELGSMVMDFQVRADMANPVGFLHGGIQNTILDDVIGLAVLTLGHEHFYVSLNLAVDYLGHARVGETVVARARVLRDGHRIINAEGELTREDGKLICRGTSNLIRSQIRVYPQLRQESA